MKIITVKADLVPTGEGNFQVLDEDGTDLTAYFSRCEGFTIEGSSDDCNRVTFHGIACKFEVQTNGALMKTPGLGGNGWREYVSAGSLSWWRRLIARLVFPVQGEPFRFNRKVSMKEFFAGAVRRVW